MLLSYKILTLWLPSILLGSEGITFPTLTHPSFIALAERFPKQGVLLLAETHRAYPFDCRRCCGLRCSYRENVRFWGARAGEYWKKGAGIFRKWRCWECWSSSFYRFAGYYWASWHSNIIELWLAWWFTGNKRTQAWGPFLHHNMRPVAQKNHGWNVPSPKSNLSKHNNKFAKFQQWLLQQSINNPPTMLS